MTATVSCYRQDLSALTGLRFFAAMAIVLHHMRGGAFGFPSEVLPQVPLGNGVSFFYVLSGFILTYVYRDTKGPRAWRRYLVARFARVWPLHLVTFALVCIIIIPPSRIGTEDGLLAAFLNLTLLHAWAPDYRYFFSFNAVSWSISAEMFFYLIFPIVLLRPATGFILSLAVVFLIMAFATLINAGTYAPGNSSPTVTSLLYINPAARSFEFILGVVTALIWMRKSPSNGRIIPSIIQSLALAFAAASWAWAPTIAASAALNPAAMVWLSHGGVTCLSSAFLIYAFANQRGLARIFAAGTLVYLGKISFALYLVHMIPIQAHNLGIKPFDTVTWPVYLIGVIAVSAALHHLIEDPARRWIIRGAKTRESRVFD